jgi:hypothetical protein
MLQHLSFGCHILLDILTGRSVVSSPYLRILPSIDRKYFLKIHLYQTLVPKQYSMTASYIALGIVRNLEM